MRYATFILAFAPLIIPTISAPTPSTNKVEITQAGTANLLAELSAAYAHSASGTSLAGTQADNILVNSRIEIDEEYLQKHQAPESMKAASPTQKTRRQTQDEIQFGHVWKWCRIQCETSWNSPLSQDVIMAGAQVRYYTGGGWQSTEFVQRGGNPSDRSAFCTEMFPNQYASGIGIHGTAATGICGNANLRMLTYQEAGWLIQQIGSTCQWESKVAGGFAECWESDQWLRVQAFRA